MDIAENIKNIKTEINQIAERCGRNPKEIILVAVSKTKPVSLIEQALENGVSIIGENKVQEATEKIPLLKGKYKEFHFIGHLQTNKIKKLLQLHPDLIHSVDKIKTAKKIDDLLKDSSRKQNILIEVNTSGEESKFGIKPNEVKAFCKELKNFNNIKVTGLMTVGKLTDNQDEIRECFKTLKNLYDELKSECSDFKYLSMGMSGDFKIAIEEGSNMVRIGSAIFGKRVYK